MRVGSSSVRVFLKLKILFPVKRFAEHIFEKVISAFERQ